MGEVEHCAQWHWCSHSRGKCCRSSNQTSRSFLVLICAYRANPSDLEIVEAPCLKIIESRYLPSCGGRDRRRLGIKNGRHGREHTVEKGRSRERERKVNGKVAERSVSLDMKAYILSECLKTS